MALSLGVSVGERIAVGDSIVEVRAINGSKRMIVAVNGAPEIEVTDDKADAVEVLPGVRLFVGLDRDGNRNRLAFDAPKSIPINRVGEENGAKEALPVLKDEMIGKTTASNIALLAPVPKEHLDDGRKAQLERGKVAFGSMKWKTFRELDELCKGMPVDVYIYESEGIGKFNANATWRGRYIGHVESDMGAHPAGLTFRPESTAKYTADNQGHWAVFWELDLLEPVPQVKEVWVGDFTGYGKKKAFGHSFSPEGPILIEHP